MRKMVNITQQLKWTDDKTDDDETNDKTDDDEIEDKTDDDERDAKTGDETDYKQPDTTEICLI